MKKNRGDKPIWVITYKYMEMSQGNALHSYLKQAIMQFFLFSSTKSEKRREQVLPRGRERGWGKVVGDLGE
jgi:hypothetical protein